MTTGGPNRPLPTDSGTAWGATTPSTMDHAQWQQWQQWSQSRRDRPPVIAEAITFVVCFVLALMLMVMVAHEGWPPWWLMVAGGLTAWAGDALWTLGEHLVTGIVARARARRHTTPGTPRAHDPGPATAPSAIEQWHRHGHGRWQDGPPAPGSDR